MRNALHHRNWFPLLRACMPMLLLIAMLTTAFTPVYAEPNAQEPPAAQGSVTLESLGYETISVRQVYDQIEFDFPLAEGQKISQATLILDLEHSPDLLGELSDLTIGLNNHPVSSMILGEGNAAQQYHTIQLPDEAFQPGENTLLLRFKLRINDTGCSDAHSSALWARVYKDTRIDFIHTNLPLNPDLSDYPSPFTSLSVFGGSPQLAFILPDDPTPAELTAATRIASSLGQASDWKEPPLLAYTYSQAAVLSTLPDHLVVINPGDRNPLVPSGAEGVALKLSPLDPNRLMLTVSGRDDTTLLQAADMLSTRSAYSAFTGTEAPISTVKPLPKQDRPAIQTFADLGIKEWQVRGIGPHDLYYPINVPYDWKITSEANIEIKFSHAHNLDSLHSTLTVYINGEKTSEIGLNNRNADNGQLIVKLSPRQLHQGRNWLHLGINLHISKEDCRYRYLDEAWLAVSSQDSTLNLAHVTSQPPLDLRYLPATFITPQDLSNDLFILPDTPGQTDLTALVRMAAKIGTYTESDGLRPRAMTAAQFMGQLKTYSASSKSYQYILVGSPTSNSVMAQYDEQLPQPLTLQEGAIQADFGRALFAQEAPAERNALPTAGYLQLLPAPWSIHSRMVVFAAYNPDSLLKVVDKAPNANERLNLQGNVAIVTSDKTVGLALGGFINYPLSVTARAAVAIVLIFAFGLIGSIGWMGNQQKRIAEESKVLSEDEEL